MAIASAARTVLVRDASTGRRRSQLGSVSGAQRGRARTIRVDHVTWVNIGARTPRVDRRSRLNTVPITTAASDERDVARGHSDDHVHNSRSDGSTVRLERSVERAAEEQLLPSTIDERDEQHDRNGTGIGGREHADDGGTQQGQVAGDQVGDEERPERSNPDHDRSDHRPPCHVRSGLQRDRSRGERSDRPRRRHPQAQDGEPHRTARHPHRGRQQRRADHDGDRGDDTSSSPRRRPIDSRWLGGRDQKVRDAHGPRRPPDEPLAPPRPWLRPRRTSSACDPTAHRAGGHAPRPRSSASRPEPAPSSNRRR